LHPGTHYRPLAQFLKGSLHKSLRIRTVSQPRPHIFAALHNLDCSFDDPNRVRFFDSKEGLDDFASYPLPRKNCGQLLFLRGYPSPKWVQLIGAKYRVDAEFFRRHLSIGQISEPFDISVLPSASQNIVKLSITSLGKQNVTLSKQGEGVDSLKDFHESLGDDPNVVGDSIVRRYSVHDKTRFSIEQDVTMCVLKTGESWIGMSTSRSGCISGHALTYVRKAIILLDCGRDLDEGPAGPWIESSSRPHMHGFDNVFNPVLLFEPNICLKSFEKKEGTSSSNGTQLLQKRCFQQSCSLLHTKSYGRFLSPAVMNTDAFYALSDVFNFAACAESQFLGLLKSKFMSETHLHNKEEHMKECLLDLKDHKLLLHEHIQGIQAVISIINDRGGSRWPRAGSASDAARMVSMTPSARRSSKESMLHVVVERPAITEQEMLPARSGAEAEAEAMAQRLLKDYEALRSDAQALSDLYSEGMRDIRDNAMLAESRKAIEQARGVGHLTLLAYFFLPLSFTSTLFGMNFKELGDDVSIWAWFVVSVPVFLLAAMLCFWDKLVPLYVKFRLKLSSSPVR